MTPRPLLLLNSQEIEIWPAWLLGARGNADARLLAQTRWALRRKRDGRYLGAMDRWGTLATMVMQLQHEAGLDDALRSGLAFGAEKVHEVATLARALQPGPAEALPIRALLRPPLQIHWCP